MNVIVMARVTTNNRSWYPFEKLLPFVQVVIDVMHSFKSIIEAAYGLAVAIVPDWSSQ